jgi:transposase InsO family protein
VVWQHVLAAAGRTTVAALKKVFPDIARRVLEQILFAVRRVLRIGRRRQLARLTWTRAGALWAADFTQLAGRGSAHAFSVRDLASGKALHVSIVPAESAEVVVTVLLDLFESHGPPLVLKMDNGSAFEAETTKDLLSAHGVLTLFSPPATPAYNGACEAGIGSVKRVSGDVALLGGHHGPPDDEHLRTAANLLNAMPRGNGAAAPCPDDLWARRAPISAALRCQLRVVYRRHEALARASAGIAKDARLSHAVQASLDRNAIREALCDLNLLSIRRS